MHNLAVEWVSDIKRLVVRKKEGALGKYHSISKEAIGKFKGRSD